MDTICYTLNRVEPRYIISSRGRNHVERDWVWRQQMEADVSVLTYKGLRLVNHKQRPMLHDASAAQEKKPQKGPVFDIPSIVGRLFNGKTFAPVDDVKVALWCDGELVPMRNQNWQNPVSMVSYTPGTYAFWPEPVHAEEEDMNRLFDYVLKIEDHQFETMVHHFRVPAVSGRLLSSVQSGKTFKLPDLYLFPPGEAEENG